MTEPDLVGLFVAPLEDAGITYMVTGGVASVVYGDPRFTRDVDLVVELDRASARRFRAAFAYLAGGDRFHAWALDRRRRIQVEGLAVWLAPIEYVVVRKLEYFRASGSDRHLRDVAMILRISAPLVDPASLHEWSVRQGVAGLVEEAREFDPDPPGADAG